ncbi:MAG TPA: hypothetical protein VFK80_08000, partial [Limnochordia bacterium]|nr:hypothetical protein [Limnochordia bacterium]
MANQVERTLPAGLRAELAAEYLLDGNAHDTSGNGRHGQIVGAKSAVDRFGRESGAYAFDGKNDYLIVVDPPKLSAEAFTLSLWARLDRREDDADTWHSALACQDSGEAFHHSFSRHGRVFQLAAKG